jgi:hypothetical protein
MAWTDQCKIDAKAQIEKRSEECGEVKKAMTELAGESGIPFHTLKRWYYDKDASIKTDTQQPPSNTQETKSRVATKIVENINKALDKEEEDAMSTAQGQAAQELANQLGGAVLAEELYELFLKSVNKLDEIVRANKELKEPMNNDKVIDQLLRLARNIGWTEPVVEELEPTSEGAYCKKCDIVVKGCANRTCEFYKEKKKKKVKVKLKAKGEK